jgi:hypothetical protein
MTQLAHSPGRTAQSGPTECSRCHDKGNCKAEEKREGELCESSAEVENFNMWACRALPVPLRGIPRILTYLILACLSLIRGDGESCQ